MTTRWTVPRSWTLPVKVAYFTDDSAGTDRCWPWRGSVDRYGYGQFNHRGKKWSAPRAAWTVTFGPITDGLCVCHACDNPRCVNPKHLWLGTSAQNTADKVSKGRAARVAGERNGLSKLSEDDIRAIRKDKRPQGVVAADYGIDQSNVHYIRSGKTWKHVQ